MERIRHIFRCGRTTSSDANETRRTPLPKPVVISCLSALFPSAFVITMLFPFLPWMVKTFTIHGQKITDLNSGPYVGLVASSLFIGRFLGSYFWGWMSDAHGRRPAMLLSLILLTLTSLMFSFVNGSLGLGWAMASRLLTGLMNGAIGTSKAILSEVSDNTNQARGLTLLTASWGLGLIVGPAIGGLLAEPARQYPSVFGDSTFLKTFPYCLPSFVCAFFSIVGLLVTFKLLPETLKSKSMYSVVNSGSSSDSNGVTQDTVIRTVSVKTSGTFSSARISFGQNPMQSPSIGSASLHINHGATELYEGDEDAMSHGLLSTEVSVADEYAAANDVLDDFESTQEPHSVSDLPDESQLMDPADAPLLTDEQVADSSLVADEDEEEEEDEELRGITALARAHDRQSSCSCWRYLLRYAIVRRLDRSKLMFLLRRQATRRALLLYSFFSFGVIGMDELYSLYCSEPPHLGGLGLGLSKIGESLAIIGSLGLPLQVFVVPMIEKRLGARKGFICLSYLLVFTTVIIPSLTALVYNTALYPTLILVTLANKFAAGGSFVFMAMMINNSVETKDLGSVNGLAMAMTAVLRALAPVVCGSTFSWSIHGDHPWPINHHFIFILLGLHFMFMACACSYLPAEIDKKLVVPDSSEPRDQERV